MGTRTIELKWDCSSCGTRDILGRHSSCTQCGSPRGKGMKMKGLSSSDYGPDGRNKAPTVTDPKLLERAKAGPDWFCEHCGRGNIGTGSSCSTCGSPRYGKPKENHPSPEFSREHLRKAQDLPLGGPPPTPPTPTPPTPTPKPKNPPPIVDEGFQEQSQAGLKGVFLGASLFAVFSMIIGFAWWSSQTHVVTGEVSGMRWKRDITVQAWTQFSVREWSHAVTLRDEVPPVNGAGERSGMALISGSCKDEHFKDEQYQCGTKEESYDCSYDESYPDTCTGSEDYVCGEDCSDNGNGFATCTDRHCTRPTTYSCTSIRRVSKTCQKTVPNYCTRQIYKEKCDYRTQKWGHARNLSRNGDGIEMKWPEANLNPLEREIRTSEYLLEVSYTDEGEKESFQEKLKESDYITWELGQKVYLKKRNLGGISDWSKNEFPKE